MELITETNSLDAACREALSAPFVTVDTEFLRENTYRPELCLIQFATPDSVYLVDPLAQDLDLSSFYDLLSASAVVKVFHAARQDVEIFYSLNETIPDPLFDTQIAAMACGMGDSIGYDTIVKRLLGANIDKSFRVSNWSHRPLSDRQMRYAAQDVSHLREVYLHLKKELERLDRLHWLTEEAAVLTDPGSYRAEPQDAWRRLKLRPSVRKKLGVLIEVAAWREQEAQARNVPRGRVLKDDALYDIVGQAPKTEQGLEKMRFLPRGFAKSGASQSLIEAIHRGLERPKEDLPPLPELKPNGAVDGAIVDLLKVLLKLQCERHGVAQKLVASTADLEKIAAGQTESIPALEGWRKTVYGSYALDLLQGKTSLVVENGRVITKNGAD